MHAVFPGMEVCAEKTVVVTSSELNFHWKEYGLKLHIPNGSLPVGMELCIIKVMVSLAGQYRFPANCHLVSAVYWFRCEPNCKQFAKSLRLEIQHCARPENISKLHFVKALCSQKDLHYTFDQQQGGCFTTSNGVLELESFSGGAIVQEGSEDREYIARLFYINPSAYACDIHMVVTWNLKAHFTVSYIISYIFITNMVHAKFNSSFCSESVNLTNQPDPVRFQCCMLYKSGRADQVC